jgi:hypothetical protein
VEEKSAETQRRAEQECAQLAGRLKQSDQEKAALQDLVRSPNWTAGTLGSQHAPRKGCPNRTSRFLVGF